VGRLDPKADRNQKAFIVRNIMFESEFEEFEGLLPVLAQTLPEFAAFNGCERIVVERTEPGKVAASLMRELDMVRQRIGDLRSIDVEQAVC